jgi:hypothetical protein
MLKKESRRSLSSSSSRRGRRDNSPWLHTGYNRNRHANVNRATGSIFFVLTAVAGGVGTMLMSRSVKNIKK